MCVVDDLNEAVVGCCGEVFAMKRFRGKYSGNAVILAPKLLTYGFTTNSSHTFTFEGSEDRPPSRNDLCINQSQSHLPQFCHRSTLSKDPKP